MHGRSSVIPRSSFRNVQTNAVVNSTDHVVPSSVDSDQKAAASKPAHITAAPPDSMGANKLRTIPPTWKRGIMFTEGH